MDYEWTFLKADEIVQEGDWYYNVIRGQWAATQMTIGECVGAHRVGKFRRKKNTSGFAKFVRRSDERCLTKT